MEIRQIAEDDALYPIMLKRFPLTARNIANPNDDGDYRFFAAVERGAVVGGAVIDIGPLGFGPLRELTIGFLENIEVDPQWRRRGIGTRLLDAALQHAWSAGAQNVRWNVWWSNDEGLAFYRSRDLGIIPEPEHDDPTAPDACYTLVAIRPA
jgi:ribosomal protein S18 acetylase RimI-like enzyme